MVENRNQTVKFFNTVPLIAAGTASVTLSQGSDSCVDMNETCVTGPNWLPRPLEKGCGIFGVTRGRKER